MIQVDLDRYERHTRTLYTSDWERLEVEFKRPAGIDVERPAALHEMLDQFDELFLAVEL